MTWTEQAETMTKVWTDAQQQFLQNWYQSFQSSAVPMMMMPFGGTYPEMIEQWRKIASDGMEMWMSGANPMSQDISRQMMSSQSTAMRLVEMTTRAWQMMAPKLDAGEEWPKVLADYMDTVRKQMITPEMFQQSFQSNNDMWAAYVEQLQLLSRPMIEAFKRTPGSFSASMSGEQNALSRVYWAAFEETFGSLVNTPGFGITREIQQKMLQGFGSWTEYRRATNEYQLVLSRTWEHIYQQVLEEMMKRAEAGKPIESLSDMMRLWTTAADAGLEEIFRSPEYLEAQNNMVNSAMRYRIDEQEIAELFMQSTYVPTRSEVDEAHRNIYELRKEVKALRKQVRELTKGGVSSNGQGVSAAPQTENV